MFDIISRQYSTFQPDIFCGTIQPNSHVNIKVTFLPMEKKIYYFPLVCFILHGTPIIIELYGYCEIPFNEQDYNIFGYELYTGLNTFEKYFNDNSRIKRSHQTPILSLSQNYLIFEKSSTLNPCQTSSITNHTSYELILEWEKGFIKRLNFTYIYIKCIIVFVQIEFFSFFFLSHFQCEMRKLCRCRWCIHSGS